MVLCTEATLARWRALTQPFDVAAEMMALTLIGNGFAIAVNEAARLKGGD